MKVLHVTHGYHPDPGGVESYLHIIATAQIAAGDEVVVLTGSIELRETCEVETCEVDGVRVIRLYRDDWYNDHYANSYHAGASRMIRDLFAAEHPDVVHVHQWIRLTSDVVALAHDAGLPTIVTLHDVYTSCPRAFRIDRDEQPCSRELSVASCAFCVPRFGYESENEVATGIELFRDQYRSELQLADRVLVATPVTADLLTKTSGTPRDRFTVQGLPYRQRFVGLAGAPVDHHPLRFGYWGSLTAHKGPHVLLQAFRDLVDRVDAPLELHMFGPITTDAIRERLESLAMDLPVTLHGEFDASRLVRAGIDVAVFPVICFEGFGLGLTEAFELGLPAIVSDIGALADRIGDAGLKVPAGDVTALTDAMARMATDADLRAACTSAIPEPPPKPAQHVDELREHYNAAIASERRTGPRIEGERRTDLALLQRESNARALRDERGRRDPS